MESSKKIVVALGLALAISGSWISGMEPEPSYATLPEELKQEIIGTMIQASNDLVETIKAIKAASALYGIPHDISAFTDLLAKKQPENLKDAISVINASPSLNELTLKDFTVLMDALVNKFHGHKLREHTDREIIARQINTPVAKKYIVLAHRFINKVLKKSNASLAEMVDAASRLLAEGVDPNFSGYYCSSGYHRGFYDVQSFLAFILNDLISCKNENMLVIALLLLKGGAKPSDSFIDNVAGLRFSNNLVGDFNDLLQDWKKYRDGK